MLNTLLAGMTVLIIGDSHLTTPGYLITSLHDDLAAQGAQVRTVGVCGANAADWLKVTPGTCGAAERVGKGEIQLKGAAGATVPIKELLAQDKPKLLVVVMGDTMAGYSLPAFPKTWIWQQVTQFTKEVASTGTTCVWVGPGWGSEGGKFGKTYARVQQTAAFLSSNVAPCTYIDSLTLSQKGQWPTTDGQHYTVPGYKQWGDALSKTITELPSVKAIKR